MWLGSVWGGELARGCWYAKHIASCVPLIKTYHTATVCVDKITYLLTHLLTYLLTPWCRVLLEKLASLQLVKKFPACYGTRRFMLALTSARYLSLSWASSIQSKLPHSTSWKPILIISSHLCLGLSSGIFHSRFPTKTLYKPLLSPTRATWPSHLILLGFITWNILGEQYSSLSS